jgi:hypothetical protein
MSTSEKFMFRVVWRVDDPLAIEWLPEGASFRSAYLCDTMIPAVIYTLTLSGGRIRRRYHQFHLDNVFRRNLKSSMECIKRNNLTLLSQPPDSPDIASNDSFLFSAERHIGGRTYICMFKWPHSTFDRTLLTAPEHGYLCNIL